MGLGKSAYAHRFSCVGVNVAKSGAIEAPAGEVTIKKRINPMLSKDTNSQTVIVIRFSRALMGSDSKWGLFPSVALGWNVHNELCPVGRI